MDEPVTEQTFLQEFLKITNDYYDEIVDASAKFHDRMEALQLKIIEKLDIQDPLEVA